MNDLQFPVIGKRTQSSKWVPFYQKSLIPLKKKKETLPWWANSNFEKQCWIGKYYIENTTDKNLKKILLDDLSISNDSFKKNESPKYYSNSVYSIDTQCPSHAINTIVNFLILYISFKVRIESFEIDYR